MVLGWQVEGQSKEDISCGGMMLARGWKKENLRGEKRLSLIGGDEFGHLDASTRGVFQPLVGYADEI